LKILPAGTVQIRIARCGNVVVAGRIVLVFGGLVYAWYSGTRRIPGIYPVDCLAWDEIQWGSENRQQVYDFGGAGRPDEDYGPRKFKSKFGGELVNYGRYQKIYSRWKLALADTAYDLARSVLFP